MHYRIPLPFPFDSTHHSLNGKAANQTTENNQLEEYAMNSHKTAPEKQLHNQLFVETA